MRPKRRNIVTDLLRESVEREAKDFRRPNSKTPLLDDTEGGGREDEGYQERMLRVFYSPTIDEQMNTGGSSLTGRSIMEELFDEVRLPPFSEPIGVIPRRVRVQPASKQKVEKNHNTRMEQQRAGMLALRAKNDQDIERLLGRRW